MDTTITTLEMCAGYGGIGLGLKNIFGERLRTIAYCELEGFAQANLLSKMEKGLLDVAPIWSDLKTFPYKSFHGMVDILIAGYPCQPFSAAGKRAGKDDPRHLWPWIADGIRILRPRMCFFENVEGHISLGLSSVISDLEELGYKVSWGIFSAREVGAPHQRKRVFILAYSELSLPARLKRICGEFGALTETERNQTYIGGVNAWPSRPGEPQHAWEPPRVVGSVPAKLANFCSRDSQQGRDTAQTSCESVSAWRESENAMPHSGSCRGGSEAMGNPSSERPHRRAQDRLGLQSEVFGEGHEAMGNANYGRLASGINAGSGTEADRGGQGDIEQTDGGMGNATSDGQQHDQQSKNRREARTTAKSSGQWQTQLPMGDSVDGTSFGVGDTKLSSISNQELAEICEWMVKCDNRTDELRLLGNGVVPATAEKAFLTLIEEINK